MNMERHQSSDGLFGARLFASLIIVAAAGGAVFITGANKKGPHTTVSVEKGQIKEFETTVFSIEDVVGFSEQVRTACKESKTDIRISNLAALCIEEMAGNIITIPLDKLR